MGGGRQMGKEGGRGNTGTSHELNRTANSSTREGEEGGDRVGGEGGGLGGGGYLFLEGGGNVHNVRYF